MTTTNILATTFGIAAIILALGFVIWLEPSTPQTGYEQCVRLALITYDTPRSDIIRHCNEVFNSTSTMSI